MPANVKIHVCVTFSPFIFKSYNAFPYTGKYLYPFFSIYLLVLYISYW